MPAESDPLEPPKALAAEEVDRLYGLALGEFIGARDALAKELRRDRRRDEAAWVKGLRKPTVAAWAVNQIVRTEKRRAKALFRAAESLGRKQEELAEGRADAAELRQAGDAERRAVSDLVDAAAQLEGDEALSDAALERVRETLHATALDEDTRRRVEAARLSQEAAAVGFGLLPAEAPAKAEKKAGRAGGRGGKAAEAKQRREAQREKEGAAREELRRLHARVKEERKAVSAARKAVRATTRERDRLQKRLDEESGRVEESQGRLERLEQEVKDAGRHVDEMRKAGDA